jgi:hypothetical protein
LESSHKRFLEDEIVFGSLKGAEKAIADDTRQFNKFKEGHIVNIGLVNVWLLWRVAADGHVVKQVTEVRINNLRLESLVNNGVKVFHQNFIVLRIADGRPYIFFWFTIAQNRRVIGLMRHPCIPFCRRFIFVHLDLAKGNHRDTCLLIHRLAERILNFLFKPRDWGIYLHFKTLFKKIHNSK